ncbi:hypothetical protein KIPB_007724 [Kipferlia bialata]|uniref:CCHC-type domain-containing protein n=1 Tax=Kipferlia bialata TaxID=797122 RepID=A0A391NQH0_9EUKA|nr:hypothetical protein KIPB_007724 [Kipferlia bialata]|eukprot:g7724.t1
MNRFSLLATPTEGAVEAPKAVVAEAPKPKAKKAQKPRGEFGSMFVGGAKEDTHKDSKRNPAPSTRRRDHDRQSGPRRDAPKGGFGKGGAGRVEDEIRNQGAEEVVVSDAEEVETTPAVPEIKKVTLKEYRATEELAEANKVEARALVADDLANVNVVTRNDDSMAAFSGKAKTQKSKTKKGKMDLTSKVMSSAPRRERSGDRSERKPRGERTEGDRKPRGERLCYNCNKPGHIGRDCPEPKKERKPRAEGAERLCYNCNKPGHIGRDCPEPKKERKPRAQKE